MSIRIINKAMFLINFTRKAYQRKEEKEDKARELG